MSQGQRSSPLTVLQYQGPGRPTRRGRPRRTHAADNERSIVQRPVAGKKHACEACKIGKTRCSGHKPCLRCVRRQQNCVYIPHTPPLASETASMYNHSPTVGEPDHAVSGHANLNEDGPGRSSLSSHFVPRDSTAEIPQTEPGSCDSRSENGNPDNDNDNSVSPIQEDQYGHIHGGASMFSFLNLAKQKLTGIPVLSIDFCDYPLTRSPHSPRVLPPKEIAEELVRSYFDFGLSTSRFVHEPSFRENYEILYANNSGNLQTDELVLIYMIFALGSHYSRITNIWHGYSASAQFYEMADQLLLNLPSRITLASVQSRLLIIHYLLNHSRMHEAWSLFGIVVRHAQALGLHDRSRNVRDNHVTRQYRQRTFWVIYIHDRILSSVFGRPCALHDEDIDQCECSLSNDENITISRCDPVPSDGLCLSAALVHYARLARILGNVLRQFYCLPNKRQSLPRLYTLATALETALDEWLLALPGYLNFTVLPSSALTITMHRQVSTLKLTYAYANLLLYRPFILHSMGSTVNSPNQVELGQWVKRSHDKSLAAADMIVSECQVLQTRGLFSKAFWMVNYCQFAAIGTLYTYKLLWPDAHHVWEVAEKARNQLPNGVQDDFIGQRYIEVLNEFSRVAADRHEQHHGAELSANGDPWPQDLDTMLTDVTTTELGGLWSNLFFNPTVFSDQ